MPDHISDDLTHIPTIVAKLSSFNGDTRSLKKFINTIIRVWDDAYTLSTQKTKFSSLKRHILAAREEGAIDDEVFLIAIKRLKLDPECYEIIAEEYRSRIIDKQLACLVYTPEQVGDYIDICIGLLCKRSKFSRLVGLCGLTGRRPYEIAAKGRFQLLDDDDPERNRYVIFTGQAKTGKISQFVFNDDGDHILDDDGNPLKVWTNIERKPYKIPLLLSGNHTSVTVDEIVMLLEELQDDFFENVKRMDYESFNSYISNSRKFAKKHFCEFTESYSNSDGSAATKFSLKSLRKFYTCVCISYFLPTKIVKNQKAVMSQIEFASSLLGHKTVSECHETELIPHYKYDTYGPKIGYKFALTEQSAYVNVSAYAVFSISSKTSDYTP